MRQLKMIVPKGRLHAKVMALLAEAGCEIENDDRVYTPRCADPEITVKLLKPQNIPALIHLGTHDIGFTGLDWVRETGAAVRQIMDLGFDPVRLVAAIPQRESAQKLKRRKIIVASEYENLTRRFLKKEKYDYVFIRTFGATEVFPPDDADMIVDNMASGRTLSRNGLKTVAVLLDSSTRFIANPGALRDPWKREKIQAMATLLQAVLAARDRVMLEMNVAADRFEQVIRILPCMRSPTVAPLHGDQGFAVKVAVRKKETPALILRLKKLGACDLLEYEFRKVVP